MGRLTFVHTATLFISLTDVVWTEPQFSPGASGLAAGSGREFKLTDIIKQALPDDDEGEYDEDGGGGGRPVTLDEEGPDGFPAFGVHPPGVSAPPPWPGFDPTAPSFALTATLRLPKNTDMRPADGYLFAVTDAADEHQSVRLGVRLVGSSVRLYRDGAVTAELPLPPGADLSRWTRLAIAADAASGRATLSVDCAAAPAEAPLAAPEAPAAPVATPKVHVGNAAPADDVPLDVLIQDLVLTDSADLANKPCDPINIDGLKDKADDGSGNEEESPADFDIQDDDKQPKGPSAECVCDVSEILKNYKGASGPPGTDGLPGPPGVAGPKGEPGVDGMPGDRGEIGLPGERGTAGEKGDKGATGPAGASGPKGEHGKNGKDGLPGTPGLKGQDGIAGAKGTGSKGEPGRSGPKGDKGEIGGRGPAGTPGKTGKAGEKGERGVDGPVGPPGPRGEPGPPGPLVSNGSSPSKGATGPRGKRGSPGPPGSVGPPGKPGPKGDVGPPGPVLKGDKGEPGQGCSACSLPDGSSQQVPVPGPPGPPGPPGVPGLSVQGEKGEPGIAGKTFRGGFYPQQSSLSGIVIFTSLEELSKQAPLCVQGTLAFLSPEETLLLRVSTGWQYVTMGRIVPIVAYHPRPVIPAETLRLAALNEPRTGAMGGQRGADHACYREARRAGLRGTFRAILSSRYQNTETIVTNSDWGTPVVNIKGDLLFNSWKSIFTESGGQLVQPSKIYSFSGKNILIDNSWPHKYAWHGSEANGERSPRFNCDAWASDSGEGLASELPPVAASPFLTPRHVSCDRPLAVLCVEVSSEVSRRRRRRSRRRLTDDSLS